MLEDLVDDADSVEAADDGHPPRDRRRRVASGLLHPVDVQLNLRALGGQGVQAPLLAPRQGGAKVRFGVRGSLATVAGQVAGDREAQRIGPPLLIEDGSGQKLRCTDVVVIFRGPQPQRRAAAPYPTATPRSTITGALPLDTPSHWTLPEP